MKDFVPYEQVLELKNLGFDEDCFGYYDTEGLQIRYNVLNPTNKNSLFTEHSITNNPKISAPTFSQAFRFFREKYNWQHSIEPTSDQHRFELGYNYYIWNNKTGEEYYTMPKNRPWGDWEYEIYEEAELSCLNKLIEIVKNK